MKITQFKKDVSFNFILVLHNFFFIFQICVFIHNEKNLTNKYIISQFKNEIAIKLLRTSTI